MGEKGLQRISRSVFETIVSSFEGRKFPETEEELGSFIAAVCNMTDDAQLKADQEAHNAVIREIRAEVNKITCLDNYKDMSEAVTQLVFNLVQKYGGK